MVISSGEGVIIYKDEKFYPILEAYELVIVTKDELGNIYNAYCDLQESQNSFIKIVIKEMVSNHAISFLIAIRTFIVYNNSNKWENYKK